MALAGVTQVTVAKALRLTQPYVSDGAALLAGLIPTHAIGSLLALAVGLVDRLGTSRLRGC